MGALQKTRRAFLLSNMAAYFMEGFVLRGTIKESYLFDALMCISWKTLHFCVKLRRKKIID